MSYYPDSTVLKILFIGVSMMNPGWEQPDDLHPFVANLTRDPSVGLTDYIVKERIFNFFLYQGG